MARPKTDPSAVSRSLARAPGLAELPATERARLAAMRYVLSLYDYEEKDVELVGEADPRILGPASRIFEQGEAVGRQFPPL